MDKLWDLSYFACRHCFQRNARRMNATVQKNFCNCRNFWKESCFPNFGIRNSWKASCFVNFGKSHCSPNFCSQNSWKVKNNDSPSFSK